MSGVFAFVRSVAHAGLAETVTSGMAAPTKHFPGHSIDVASPSPDVGLGLHDFAARGHRVERTGSDEAPLWIALTGTIFRRRTERVPAAGSGPSAAALVADAYHRGGADALAALVGEFTLALWDTALGELIVVNDRFGLHPHYWTRTAAGFALAPELKSLLTVPGVPRSLDPIAIGQYVRFQQFLDDRTWFTDIRVLPPATILRVRLADGRLRMEQYWNWSRIDARRRVSLEDAAAEIDLLFDEAIARRLDGARRPAVYLSGGLDSRMILGYARQHTAMSALTYGAEQSRDVVLARRVARSAGVPIRVFPLADGRWVQTFAALHMALAEGMHGWHHLHGITTLEAAREAIDLNVTGWGGGSLLAGHLLSPHLHGQSRPTNVTESQLLDRLFDSFCARFTWPGLTDTEATGVLQRVNGVPLAPLAYDSLRTSLAQTVHYPEDRRADYYYTLQHDRRSTMTLIVFHRAAMDVRCPYFDYDLIDGVYSLPSAVRLNARLRWAIMDRRLRALARIPHDRDWRLPVVNPVRRAVHGLGTRARSRINRLAPVWPLPDTLYADYESYLRTDLRAWAEDLLLSPRAADRGFFAPDAVRALWQRHLSGRELWTIGKIAPLMTVELYLRQTVD